MIDRRSGCEEVLLVIQAVLAQELLVPPVGFAFASRGLCSQRTKRFLLLATCPKFLSHPLLKVNLLLNFERIHPARHRRYSRPVPGTWGAGTRRVRRRRHRRRRPVCNSGCRCIFCNVNSVPLARSRPPFSPRRPRPRPRSSLRAGFEPPRLK